MTHPSGVNRNLPKWMHEVKKAEGGAVGYRPSTPGHMQEQDAVTPRNTSLDDAMSAPGKRRGGRLKKAEGGSVTDDDMALAKARLSEALKDREADIYNPEHSIMDRDRREATHNAAASGDYDDSGTYKPFNPKRGPR